jgi:hypothetical protein
MAKKVHLTLSVLILLIFPFVACNRLWNRHPPSAVAAAKQLRELQSNLDVGVDFESYDKLLRAANLAVAESSAELPNGELKKELNATIEAYRDAHSIWKYQRANATQRLLQDSSLGQAVIGKYAIQTHEMYPRLSNAQPGKPSEAVIADGSNPNPLYADVGEARSKVWLEAMTHLERVNELLKN